MFRPPFCSVKNFAPYRSPRRTRTRSRNIDGQGRQYGVRRVIVRPAGGWLAIVKESVLQCAAHVLQEPSRDAGHDGVAVVENPQWQSVRFIVLPIIRARKGIACVKVGAFGSGEIAARERGV